MKFVCTDIESHFRVVSVLGDIDGANAADFRLACSSSRPIVVDLSSCPYIDSNGLNVLVSQSHRNTIVLVLSPACRIYRIFAITNLLSQFATASTLHDALALLDAAARAIGENTATLSAAS